MRQNKFHAPIKILTPTNKGRSAKTSDRRNYFRNETVLILLLFAAHTVGAWNMKLKIDIINKSDDYSEKASFDKRDTDIVLINDIRLYFESAYVPTIFAIVYPVRQCALLIALASQQQLGEFWLFQRNEDMPRFSRYLLTAPALENPCPFYNKAHRLLLETTRMTSQ